MYELKKPFRMLASIMSFPAIISSNILTPLLCRYVCMCSCVNMYMYVSCCITFVVGGIIVLHIHCLQSRWKALDIAWITMYVCMYVCV